MDSYIKEIQALTFSAENINKLSEIVDSTIKLLKKENPKRKENQVLHYLLLVKEKHQLKRLLEEEDETEQKYLFVSTKNTLINDLSLFQIRSK